MIDVLDLALTRLFDDQGAPTEVRDADVSFETPERTYRPAQPTINLFLAEIHEDVEARDPVPVREVTEAGIVTHPAPVRVVCRYMLTVWSPGSDSAAQRVAAEHRLLGAALSWLAGHPTFPDHVLGSGLATQPGPVRLGVGRPGPGKELGDLWVSLGNSPRPAVWVDARVALVVGSDTFIGPPVSDIGVRVRDGNGPSGKPPHSAGRRVRGPSGPLTGAEVSLTSLGLILFTDDAGVFRIPSIPEGTYELTAAAAGHRTATTSIHVPATAADNRDIDLEPDI